VGLGVLNPTEITALANHVVSLVFDSIWLSEVLSLAGLDPTRQF
jgi:hypothetical protein